MILRALVLVLCTALPAFAQGLVPNAPNCPTDLEQTGQYAGVLERSQNGYQKQVALLMWQIAQLQKALAAATEKKPEKPPAPENSQEMP